MTQLENKAIRASKNFAKLISNSFLVIKYNPQDDEWIIKYKKRIANPKRRTVVEGTLHVIGDSFNVSGSNKNFVNYITDELS